jgi:Xaa-Pro aminopeptidase
VPRRKKLEKETDLIPLEEEIKNFRAVKDAQEMVLIRRAIEIASNAFLHITDMLKEGVSEEHIAQEMEFSMKRKGAEDTGFDIIFFWSPGNGYGQTWSWHAY